MIADRRLVVVVDDDQAVDAALAPSWRAASSRLVVAAIVSAGLVMRWRTARPGQSRPEVLGRAGAHEVGLAEHADERPARVDHRAGR